MKQAACMVAIVVAGSALTGCLNVNQQYGYGFRTWGQDPMHRQWDQGLEQHRAYEENAKYEKRLTNVDFKDGKTPTQIAEMVAEKLGTSVYRRDDIRDGIRLYGGFGPIEKEMVWPLLSNAIEMGSHNAVIAISQTDFPWEVGRTEVYVQKIPYDEKDEASEVSEVSEESEESEESEKKE